MEEGEYREEDEAEKNFRPKRCVLWFAHEVHCIADTRMYSHNLCPAHYVLGLSLFGKPWIDAVPRGVKIRASGSIESITKETYTRAFKLARARRKLSPSENKKHYYAVKGDDLHRMVKLTT